MCLQVKEHKEISVAGAQQVRGVWEKIRPKKEGDQIMKDLTGYCKCLDFYRVK